MNFFEWTLRLRILNRHMTARRGECSNVSIEKAPTIRSAYRGACSDGRLLVATAIESFASQLARLAKPSVVMARANRGN